MLPLFPCVVNYGDSTPSLGVPTMDVNPGMYLNPYVKDIKNENINNTDDTNMFLRIECNILDNVPGTISMRQMRTHASRIYDHFFLNKELGFQSQLMLQLMTM